MSSPGYSSNPVHWSRWSPSILAWPRQQPCRASGSILPKSHVRRLGKSGKHSCASRDLYLTMCLRTKSTVAMISHGYPGLLVF
ncbi:hypothetical protein TNCV_4196141 [Trichonephila clavipes]|nr:hypothetical protein TNCV_4196141 [Trichonephila clavipes]